MYSADQRIDEARTRTFNILCINGCYQSVKKKRCWSCQRTVKKSELFTKEVRLLFCYKSRHCPLVKILCTVDFFRKDYHLKIIILCNYPKCSLTKALMFSTMALCLLITRKG